MLGQLITESYEYLKRKQLEEGVVDYVKNNPGKVAAGVAGAGLAGLAGYEGYKHWDDIKDYAQSHWPFNHGQPGIQTNGDAVPAQIADKQYAKGFVDAYNNYLAAGKTPMEAQKLAAQAVGTFTGK